MTSLEASNRVSGSRPLRWRAAGHGVAASFCSVPVALSMREMGHEVNTCLGGLGTLVGTFAGHGGCLLAMTRQPTSENRAAVCAHLYRYKVGTIGGADSVTGTGDGAPHDRSPPW